MLALLLPQVWLETGYGRSSAFAQSKREHGSRTPHKRSSNSEHEFLPFTVTFLSLYQVPIANPVLPLLLRTAGDERLPLQERLRR
jgi:hypothetical protein